MALTLATIRERTRYKLGDLQYPRLQWTDDDIDQAVSDAVDAFSDKLPSRQPPATLPISVINYRATVDVSTLTDLLVALAVEYPIGTRYYVPSYVGFLYLRESNELLLDYRAREGEDAANAIVHWGKKHTCIEASGTIPDGHLGLISDLAAARILATYAVRDPDVIQQSILLDATAHRELSAVMPEGSVHKTIMRSQWL